MFKILAYFKVDMEERDPIVVFMKFLSLLTPFMELFGLKISCLLEMVKPLWEIWSLRNVFGIRHKIRSIISMGIMAYSMYLCFKSVLGRKVNIIVFLVLERSIRILNLRGVFKLLWMLPVNLWLICQFIAHTVGLMTRCCGHLLLGVLFGFTVGFQINSLILQPLNYWKIHKVTISICFGLTSGDVHYMYWTQTCIIIRRFLGGIYVQVYDSFLGFQMSIFSHCECETFSDWLYFTSISCRLWWYISEFVQFEGDWYCCGLYSN